MSRASQPNSRSTWTLVPVPSGSMPLPGQSCGSWITPSRVMCVELMIFRMARACQESVLSLRSSLMDKARTNSSVLVVVRRDAKIPLHRQIETSIRNSIRAGRLPRGSSLPPSRVLAADLGVSRGVVVEAYQQLTSEGYLASRAGGFTQVAAGPSRVSAGLRLARDTPPRIDLSYGRADVSSFPRAAWLRAIRGALASAPNELFGYLAGSGVPELRTA